MLADMEQKMQVIKKNLKAAHDRHKSYADGSRLFKEFQVGERVYLCVKPRKRSSQIGSCANLTPQFCGPFSIIESIGLVTYQLPLPPTVKVHEVFHVSFLKKYSKDVDHVINRPVLQVELDGEIELKPQCILQKKVLMLQN